MTVLVLFFTVPICTMLYYVLRLLSLEVTKAIYILGSYGSWNVLMKIVRMLYQFLILF